ncbi:hypothetical protein FFA01_21810 [Frigoribacterium faeni]|uniref:M23ase beta-sheet core domain-containing protein n=1 Tax=Frigoribacterium faeni TaxID=145483 RepID=A0ABQ0UQZ7_9MICO|nr:hypothetical protein FFA01_21810 [Frigoribacterium faeni]
MVDGVAAEKKREHPPLRPDNPEDPSDVSKYQNIAEPDGDGTPSLRAEDELLVSVSDTATASITIPTIAPVYATRREAREAERAAAALAGATSTGSPATVVEPVLVVPAATTAPSPLASVADTDADAPATSGAAVDPDSRRARRAAEASSRTRGQRSTTARATAARSTGARSTGARSTPARSASARPTAPRASRAAATPAATSAAPRGASFARASKRVTVVGAMLFAGAMLVATSVPANAFFVDTPEVTAAKKAAGAQSFVAAGAAPEASVSRDGYSVSTIVVNEYASTSASTFTNDVAGTVQWPFQTGVPISSGFGARQVSNCSFCSTFHQGLDFIPGAGSPIQSIADGVVSAVSGPSGAFGNHVEIEHVINGQKVTSTYSHMQTGSVTVAVGDTVTVGQIVGAVGSTGNSTGAHLHFEIHLNGVPVDPYPWLTANTN